MNKILLKTSLFATAAALVLSACNAATPTAAPTAKPAATTAPAAPAATAKPADPTKPAEPTKPAAPSATATAAPTVAPPTAVPAKAKGGTIRKSTSGFKGTLQYWVLGYQPNRANATGRLMDDAVAQFTADNPDIKVEITGYTGDQAGFTKLTQAVQGGQSVDMFRLPSDILPLLVRDDLVEPIDAYLTPDDKADIYPNLIEAVSVKGKAYAWPLWVPPVGMYLNLDVFKEKGVDLPSKTWTYDQFVETAKKLTFTRANGEKVYGFTAGIDPGLVNAWPLFMNEATTVLPLNKDNTKFTFDTPESIAGLQRFADLALVHKVTPPDFGSQAIADIANGFKKGVYAMYPEPSGASSGYVADKINFDVWPMPIGKSGVPVTAGGIGLISVAKGKDAARVKAAMDLARYLTSKEVGDDVTGFYLAPGARKSVKVADPISKFEPFVASCYITPIIADWPAIRTIIHPELQNIIFGKKKAEDAMKGIAPEINKLLAAAK
ncbi:MAG: sugar ABC transporter substrate-binding protein [Thermoflexales bacterium]|nr:sugar ABC transporter substrate-binding protein [Thermoflexales bacterium]